MAKDTSKTLRAALTATAPVFFGYIFVGMAFGLLLQKAGYNALWAFRCSLTVYAGSMQFVLVELLTSWVGLAQTAVVTLAVQARHAFYGLSLIDKFKGLGKKKPYLIFALTDETYSLLCSVKTPEGCDRGKFYLLISALNQSYWIVGGVLGATIGELVPFNSTGIDFAMTALFIVIFVEQWLTAKSHIPAPSWGSPARRSACCCSAPTAFCRPRCCSPSRCSSPGAARSNGRSVPRRRNPPGMF
ncbi:MAG: AzlC family ABC transporter permease [Anaerotruncus massiliensis (ex Togo et al. 2019)]